MSKITDARFADQVIQWLEAQKEIKEYEEKTRNAYQKALDAIDEIRAIITPVAYEAGIGDNDRKNFIFHEGVVVEFFSSVEDGPEAFDIHSVLSIDDLKKAFERANSKKVVNDIAQKIREERMNK
jgi:hypothetical protein